MDRKLKVVALFFILCLASGGLVSASSLLGASGLTQDWAYAAITELGQGRDIPGFDTLVDPNRNQGALLVARLLQHLSGEDHLESRRFGVSKNVYLDNMIFSYNQRVSPEQALTVRQVELLYQLVLEFSEELEILGYAVQDFKLLYAQNMAGQQAGMFANRNLLYSEQALSAARKREEQSAFVEVEEPTVERELSVTPLVPEPIGTRNLWTGQASSVPRFFPSPSSLVVEEPQTEQNIPIQIPGVELSGALRPVTSSTQSVEGSSASSPEGGAGYGISVRVGDLALKTAVDLGVDPQSVPQVASTSVDLSWDWADLFTVSAGYRQGVKLRDNVDLNDETTPLVTSLGVVVPINRGQVHLGMTQEWNFTGLGGNSLPNEELAMSASTAEVGLSYDLKNDSSLRFNYRLIDFSNLEKEYGAEAAFSIKF